MGISHTKVAISLQIHANRLLIHLFDCHLARGGKPSDKQNFVLLCKELKESFRPHNLLLTSAFGSAISIINPSYDLRGLNRYLDYFHVMTYDYSFAWSGRIAPNAPLDYEGTHSIKSTIQHFIKLGASPSKIVLGIPFYARTYTTAGTGKFGDQAIGDGFQGPYSRTNGYMGYDEICELFNNPAWGWKATFDQRTAQAIVRRKTGANTQVAVYDSPKSIIMKMRYAMSLRLAGAMVWSIDTDDFRGTCNNEGKNKAYPLLKAINQAMVESEVTTVKSVFALFYSAITKE